MPLRRAAAGWAPTASAAAHAAAARARNAARQRAQGVRQVAQPQLRVAAQELCPGLLDERHPERAAGCVARVDWPAMLVVRQPIIDGEGHPRLANEELQRVHAVLPAAH